MGDAYDNAIDESFLASLECDLIHRKIWPTRTWWLHGISPARAAHQTLR